MYYVYILYSESANKYYIGHTNDPLVRLEEHNSLLKNSFTSKFRPWLLKVYFPVSDLRGDAIRAERYLKKWKSRIIIEKLIKNPETFVSILDKVRAIPTSRD